MVRRRGNSFQADVFMGGTRVRRSFKTLREAEAFESQPIWTSRKAYKNTLQGFYNKHFDYLWGDAKAPKAVKQVFKGLLEHIAPTTPLLDINRVFIINMTAQMKRDGRSNGTINRHLSVLSKLLRHAERIDVIPKRPHIVYMKEPHGRERVLSPEEERRMDLFFRHCGMMEAWALSFFLLYTGCRKGEAYALTRASVADNRITFGYKTTKNSKTRVVPLVGPAATAWKLIKSTSATGRPFRGYPKDTFRNHWNRLREHMGLLDDDEFVPHMLRHTCATRLVSQGIPIPKVMLWMGHTCVQTTLRYSHLAPDDLVGAADALAKYDRIPPLEKHDNLIAFPPWVSR